MAKRIRKWIRSPGPRPPLFRRGPRGAVLQIGPGLPFISPFTSDPARVLIKALRDRGVPVRTEVPFAGGRSRRGGMVVDLWLPTVGGARNGTVVRVQGEYWHGTTEAHIKDDAQALYLRASGYRVVDVWVRDIETRLAWVLREQIGV